MAIQTRYIYLLRYILPVTDLLLLNAVYFSSYLITSQLGETLSHETNYHHVVVCNLVWLFSASFFGLQNAHGVGKLEKIYRGTWKSVVLHLGLFAVYLLFTGNAEFSRTFLVYFYCLLCTGFILSRFIGTTFRYLILHKFNATRKVAIIGTDHTASRLALYFENQSNVDFYGFIADDESFYSRNGTPLSPVFSGKLAAAAGIGVKDVYVVIANHRINEIGPLAKEADRLCIRLKFVPNLGGPLSAPYKVHYMGSEFPVITLRHEPLEDLNNRFKKRAFDIVFSGLVIVLIMSWLYPIIALLIKLQSRGPVLFRQLRSGRNDDAFVCLKFRSMQLNEDCDEVQATKDDLRVTSIGRFLRRTNLDEMPQFFNVFKGDMSIVGPRPHMLKHTEQYKLIINQYMVRHFLKPGITGWAQVNGLRGETKELKDMQRRVECDIFYLERWTAMLDVKIIFMTITDMMKGNKNAY
ncbi:undecaprenyl-phosphate glucose phosphotransferase [Pedobacter sp. AW31-3R]|uniref:undecaprenyl-phosphate glucose phosphotransferase n=1 Tax=Pedobacter sp. AW31-3R TaxID=3445781 RepID=UPI003F9F88FE